MQYTHYLYSNDNVSIIVNRMPIWFKEIKVEGDKDNGRIILHSQDEYDEIWGASAKMEINWEKKSRLDYFHAKQVQESIDMFNAINVVITEKQNTWHRSHEFTYWFGQRTKMIRKRYYPENIIHGVFYCDLTERQFNLTTYIIRKHFEGYKPYVIDGYLSVICHE
ncbi:MAG: hypothetical protein ACP6IY_08700 [Promethearchaeia archaeon]